MTLRPSGPHRGQLPSPGGDERLRPAYADPSGAHSARPDQEPSPASPPLLRVVKGEPTAEELAALTVVVAAMSQRRERRRPTPVGAWASYADGHRGALAHGHGGWRAAGRFA
ncbi:acyl-CoA carboxylase subunit epsilon [Blastococcus sp. VKM Ac-2987]|uniref:acyl-CoA carboxylase subunit epsilon n=1 Tax=Blastococcus sp. VKM Ac-2987 TaxID=3004141 RepID=UPI0022ABA8B4|nr:acyl-CoA carboxylase subunit epsilon [Blastococcus sp. VKM Ac-2987]MCZ2859532.1 acyl-CoA carboxylase subunit epsilon [Blastococcus sp. VKM Ac-2987]